MRVPTVVVNGNTVRTVIVVEVVNGVDLILAIEVRDNSLIVFN
jgi:hypothetical protein